jgi:prepilin-type N-terminal cleavage/methylation domain-containing protein
MKVLMPNTHEQGFTLIEIVLVLAITGLLFVVAFQGQSQLRYQALFDSSVSKMVQDIAQTRNEATAGVNTTGTGTGAYAGGGGCGAGDYVFAGTSWTADSHVSASRIATFTVDFYNAAIDKSNDPQGVLTGVACKFKSETLTMPSDVMVNSTLVLAKRGVRVLFVRSVTGDLVTCSEASMTASVLPTFGAGACTAPDTAIPAAGLTFSVKDVDGRTSQVLMDPSGLAKRLN